MHVDDCCSPCITPAAFASGKQPSSTVCLWTHLSATDSLEMRAFTTCCGMVRYALWLICCLICPQPIQASWAAICPHIKRSATTISGFIYNLWSLEKKVFTDWHERCSGSERAPPWRCKWAVAENNNLKTSNIHWNKKTEKQTNPGELVVWTNT